VPDHRIDDLFVELEESAKNRRMPPIHRWRSAAEGQIDIRIARDGSWYHEGRAFTRPALVRLFSTVLLREGDSYFLVSPHEKLRIVVEDVPLLALDFEVRGAGEDSELLFSTNGGDLVVASHEHPIALRSGRPYLEVRDGLEALIIRSAFYRLMDLAVERDGRPCLFSRGACFFLD
jgi:uncharacterized protein